MTTLHQTHSKTDVCTAVRVYSCFLYFMV